MNDTKNILIAWFSTVSSIFAAVDSREFIAVISAIVLPVIFFTVGKTVDVLVQMYIKMKDRK